MVKYGLCLLWFCFFLGFTMAQELPSDSLGGMFRHMPDDSLKVDALLDQAIKLRRNAPMRALRYGQEAEVLAGRLSYLRGHLLSLQLLAFVYRTDGAYSQAIAAIEKGLSLLPEGAPPEKKASLLNSLATIHTVQGSYQLALANYLKALTLLEGDEYATNRAALFNNVAIIFTRQKEYGKAKEYYLRSFAIVEKENDTLAMANAYNNLGIILAEEGDSMKARSLYLKAISLGMQTHDPYAQASALNNLGTLYLGLKRLDTAWVCLNEALRLKEASGDRVGLAGVYHSLGEHALKGNKPGQAINYFRKSLVLAQELNAKDRILESYEGLHKSYARRQNYSQAYAMQLKYLAWKDSLFNEEISLALYEMTAKYEDESKDQAIRLLSKDNEIAQTRLHSQRILNISLIIGLVALTLLSIFFIYGYRKNRSQNQLLSLQKEQISTQNLSLEEKNQALQELNEEKNYLVGVVAHDLNNPLSKIKGLASILRREAGYLTPPHLKFLDFIENTSGELGRMVNRILDIEAIEAKSLHLHLERLDIGTVLDSVTSDFLEDAANKSIDLLRVGDKQARFVNIDREFAKQAFENLVSNAIKYSPYNSRIEVEIREKEDKVQALIRDQGPGIKNEDIPKLFRKYQTLSTPTTAGESSTGLGLSIVKKYVEAMDGRVWCDSYPGHGSTFIVEFDRA